MRYILYVRSARALSLESGLPVQVVSRTLAHSGGGDGDGGDGSGLGSPTAKSTNGNHCGGTVLGFDETGLMSMPVSPLHTRPCQLKASGQEER